MKEVGSKPTLSYVTSVMGPCLKHESLGKKTDQLLPGAWGAHGILGAMELFNTLCWWVRENTHLSKFIQLHTQNGELYVNDISLNFKKNDNYSNWSMQSVLSVDSHSPSGCLQNLQ